jgi:peptidoglycan/xylan/chitin deacetylase (PgdA/CDA1 family)
MEIALCFDLYDDDTGLPHVLAALRRNNIRATFFLNGDFIRRNPAAAAAIAEAGHETASLFYAPLDFSDSRYRITQEFITRGLARNEDEFFNATGRELSLLWHPPFFRSSSLINNAASAAGYFTVERTIDPGDWLSRGDAVRLNLRQTTPSQMIETIIETKSASAVVPVRLGLLPGGRDEYLFQRIDVLLDALLRSGCVIVPVSTVTGR